MIKHVTDPSHHLGWEKHLSVWVSWAHCLWVVTTRCWLYYSLVASESLFLIHRVHHHHLHLLHLLHYFHLHVHHIMHLCLAALTFELVSINWRQHRPHPIDVHVTISEHGAESAQVIGIALAHLRVNSKQASPRSHFFISARLFGIHWEHSVVFLVMHQCAMASHFRPLISIVWIDIFNL